MSLYERLEEFRHQRREGKEEFAKHIGIGRHRYWELSQGGGLNSEHLLKAATYLGIRPEELTGDTEAQTAVITETGTPHFEVEPPLPIAIPVLAEGSAGESNGFVDYAYWAPAKVARRTIKAVRVDGDCLEPTLYSGNTAFVDTNLSPQNGDIVLCLMDGRLVLKRYRSVDGNQWLETRHGKVRFEDCEIQGVVIERNERLRK